MNRNTWKSIVVMLFGSILAACDGGGSSDVIPPATQLPQPTSQAIVVAASLGKVVGAGAQAFDDAGEPLSEEVDTDDSGTATLEIPAGHSGSILLVLRGKAGATYYDEASGENEDFPMGQQIRAALPAPQASAGVTLLTELAVRLIEASGDPLSPEAVDAANERIRAALAPEVLDLLTPPTIVDDTTAAGDVDDSDGGKLAARLAALAMLAMGDATPALTVLQQLADDVVDGVIDGVGAAGTIAGTVYDPVTFADDFTQAVRDFAGAFGSDALQSAVQDAAASTDVDGDDGTGASGDGGDAGGGGGDTSGGTDGGDGAAGGFVTEPGTVNAALVGSYVLVYFDSDAAGRDPFADGQEVDAVIGADNTLTIGSIGPLTDPFLQSGPAGGAVNPAEIIWEDPATGLIYGLSANDTGVFNEINVGDPTNPQASGFPGFVGQLTEVVAGEATEAEQAAQAFALLGTNSSDFRIVRSCSGSACPDTTAVGESVQIIVDERNGRVTFGSIVIDPAAEGYLYDEQNELSGVEPRLQATAPDGAGGSYELRVYPAQFTAGGPPVAAVQLSREGQRVYAEFPEALRGGPVNDYFTSFAATTAMPVRLVYVLDDATYNGKGNSITSAPFGVSPLCRSFEVQGVNGPSGPPAASSNFRPQFAWVNGSMSIDSYEAKVSRVRTMPSTLTFNGGQFVSTSAGVRLDEGFIDTSTGFVEMPRDQATSQQSEIDDACAAFSSLGGMLTMDQAGSLTLQIADTADGDATIYERTFVFDAATSLPWDELLPDGLAYAVSATAFGAGGTMLSCTATNATGTLVAATSNADVSCVAPTP